MPALQWYEAVDVLQPHIVRISTPSGSGTGFLLSRGRRQPLIAIATAAHVVDHAHYWEQPIRVTHAASGKFRLLRPTDRAVFVDSSRDTAVIMLMDNELPFPEDPIRLAPEGKHLRVGNELGWLGFPAVSSADLCFFSGRISAYRTETYLVDGVAINGVSGGPAFHCFPDGITLVGVLSAYIPNRATGETLPGLAMVQNVRHFHELAPTFSTLDEAKETETPSTPPSPPPDSGPASAESTGSRRAT